MGKTWQPEDIPNLEGKVAVVTGANGGAGLHTAKHLAAHGAKVYFAARSETKAQHVRDTIRGIYPDIPADRLVWLKIDLSDVRSILDAAAEVKSKEDKVDILINNAAYIPYTPEKTKHGWESGFAVNHFGPYILTMALMPLLKTAAAAPNSDVRIVNTGSNAHHIFVPDDYPVPVDSPSLWEGPVPYETLKWRFLGRFCFRGNMIRYGISKLTLAMLTRDLQRRLDAAGIPILCLSPHPGSVASAGIYDLATPIFSVAVRLVFLSEDEGSWHNLLAATDETVRRDAENFKGRYLEKRGVPHPGHALLRDEEACRQVWENTTREVDSYLSKAGLEPLPRL